MVFIFSSVSDSLSLWLTVMLKKPTYVRVIPVNHSLGQGLGRGDSFGVVHLFTNQDDEEVVFVADYELVAVENGLVANAGHGLGLCLESCFRILHVRVERTPAAGMKLQRHALARLCHRFSFFAQVLARRCRAEPL